MRDIDVDDAETVGDCPVDVVRETVELKELTLALKGKGEGGNGALLRMCCGARLRCHKGLVARIHWVYVIVSIYVYREGRDLRIMNDKQDLSGFMQFRGSKDLILE